MNTNVTQAQQEMILYIIKTLIKSASTYRGFLKYGTLVVIKNLGVMYSINLMDRLPRDLICTFTFRSGEDPQFGFDPDLLYEIEGSIMPLDIFPERDYPIFADQDFDSNPTFDEVRNSKASDGAVQITLPTSEPYEVMSLLYKGIFNMNKPDRISLELFDVSYRYNVPAGTYIVFRYTIFKAKLKRNFVISYMVLNMLANRRGVGM